ncbi:MAG: DUF4097 family beta strand repeat protein [Candidatus Aminicenantes bacterium]|nr:DUF4097 family beta strand repeat protein [Candidatus Aminicenantes bacterium]
MKLNKTAKLAAILTAVFFLMASYSLEAAKKEKYEEKFEKTVSLAKDGEVILKNISGTVEVKGWNKGEVRIEALKISKASTVEKAKENAKKVKINVEKEGNTLRIKTEYPENLGRKERRSISVSVKYNLMIPAEASAKINNVSGSVTLEEIGGTVKASVTSGKLVVTKASKGVDCETVSGSLKVQDIKGNVYLKTVSGGITAERIRGSIKANVTSGSINLIDVSEANEVEAKVLSGTVTYKGSINRDGRYTLKSHSGSIKMTLPSDSGFDLVAKTFSGRINSDFDITVSGKIGKREISGKVNDGGAVVKLSTFSGSITLRKK